MAAFWCGLYFFLWLFGRTIFEVPPSPPHPPRCYDGPLLPRRSCFVLVVRRPTLRFFLTTRARDARTHTHTHTHLALGTLRVRVCQGMPRSDAFLLLADLPMWCSCLVVLD